MYLCLQVQNLLNNIKNKKVGCRLKNKSWYRLRTTPTGTKRYNKSKHFKTAKFENQSSILTFNHFYEIVLLFLKTSFLYSII